MNALSEGITHDFYFFFNSFVVSKCSVQVSRVKGKQCTGLGLQPLQGHGAQTAVAPRTRGSACVYCWTFVTTRAM